MQTKAKKTGNLEYEVNRQDFQKYSDMQIEAFKMVQNNFEEFSMTYPLHIWVLLYLEKERNHHGSDVQDRHHRCWQYGRRSCAGIEAFLRGYSAHCHSSAFRDS